MKYEIIKHGPCDFNPRSASLYYEPGLDHEVTGVGATEDEAFDEARDHIYRAYRDDWESSGLCAALVKEAQDMSLSLDNEGRDFYVTIRFSLIQDVK